MVESVDLDRNPEWASDHQIEDIITGVTSNAEVDYRMEDLGPNSGFF